MRGTIGSSSLSGYSGRVATTLCFRPIAQSASEERRGERRDYSLPCVSVGVAQSTTSYSPLLLRGKFTLLFLQPRTLIDIFLLFAGNNDAKNTIMKALG